MRKEGDEVYLDKQLAITRNGESSTRLSVSGAIDCYNAEAVAAALVRELVYGATGGNGDLHIDVSLLEFTDVAGIRALIGIAENNGAGRRLILSGLPERIRTVITLIGWADLPSLVLEDAD